MSETRTIAVCGKGGVGKTTVAALMVRALADGEKKRILAIDADPAIGLSYALGVDVVKTVDDIRNDLIRRVRDDEVGDRTDTLRLLDYEVFDALSERQGFALLAIGRPEGEGCYCQVNSLLKDVIESLAENFDMIIIDGEAGIEQINRRVLKSVDHLILVSDSSLKGLNVAKVIEKVARENRAVDYRSTGLLLNRIRNEEEVETIVKDLDLDLLGWIPEDELVRKYDLEGRPYLEFPGESPTSGVIRNILDSVGI
jgi:CO dehydrogenase maturation factor